MMYGLILCLVILITNPNHWMHCQTFRLNAEFLLVRLYLADISNYCFFTKQIQYR